MCGIVGMSLRRSVEERLGRIDELRESFTKMLCIAEDRGRAATGAMIMSRESATAVPKAYILRAPLPAKDFVKTGEYQSFIEKFNENTLSIIGHTRAVSGNNAGAEDNRNNHPHMYGSIVGVHNGRVINDIRLWNKYLASMKPKSRCDSEVIFALVNRKLQHRPSIRTEVAIAEAFEELDMWFAIALINLKQPGKVFLARDNGHSPLSLAWHTETGTAVFGSTPNYIRDGFKVYTGHLRRYEVPTMQLITLDSDHPGAPDELFVGEYDLTPKISRSKVDQLVQENESDFQTTQGK